MPRQPKRVLFLCVVACLLLSAVAAWCWGLYVNSVTSLEKSEKDLQLQLRSARATEDYLAFAENIEGRSLGRFDARTLSSLDHDPGNTKSGGLLNGTLIVYVFSLQGCRVCLLEELDLVESDSSFRTTDAKAHIVYVVRDTSEFEIRKFARIRRLRNPVYQDRYDTLRSRWGLKSYNFFAVALLGEHAIYAHLPPLSDRLRSRAFLEKAKRLM